MIRILHVEAAPSYGGSVRALQAYLDNTCRADLAHDVLFYYPVVEPRKLAACADNVFILNPQHAFYEETTTAQGSIKTLVKSLPYADDCADAIRLISSLPTSARILSVLWRRRYDLVHLNNSFTFQPATLLAAKLAKLPVVAYMRNPQRTTSINKILMRMPSCIVSVSRFHEKALRAANSTVNVVTCYDSITRLCPDESRVRELRKALGGSDHPILVGSVGRLDEQKGYDDLVRAAAHVAGRRSDVKFVVAGEGPCRRSLEELIAGLDLRGKVELCGFVPNIADFLACLDVFVSSSRWEGLPLALVEAMSLGIPVVATDVCANSEIVVPGRSGRLVPGCDPYALAEAILSILENRSQDEIKTALQIVHNLFDPVGNAARFDAILAEAASTPAKPHQPI